MPAWLRPVSLALVAASIGWPLVLATAAWPDASGRPSAWSAIVYLSASRLCHQRADRSFHTAGVQWPVCARCSGLYLAAPVGAVAAVIGRRRLRFGLNRLHRSQSGAGMDGFRFDHLRLRRWR